MRRIMASKTFEFTQVVTALSADTIVTIEAAGTALLPQRTGGHATNRIVQLTQLLATLVHPDHAIDKLAFRKSLERRAANSVKALANDLNCYARFASTRPSHALPARAYDLVAYLEDCEARGLSPATASRRLASLAAIHALLEVSSPTPATMVRDAMIGYRKRIGSTCTVVRGCEPPKKASRLVRMPLESTPRIEGPSLSSPVGETLAVCSRMRESVSGPANRSRSSCVVTTTL